MLVTPGILMFSRKSFHCNFAQVFQNWMSDSSAIDEAHRVFILLVIQNEGGIISWRLFYNLQHLPPLYCKTRARVASGGYKSKQ